MPRMDPCCTVPAMMTMMMMMTTIAQNGSSLHCASNDDNDYDDDNDCPEWTLIAHQLMQQGCRSFQHDQGEVQLCRLGMKESFCPHQNEIILLMMILIPLKETENSHLTGSNGHAWPAQLSINSSDSIAVGQWFRHALLSVVTVS